MPVGPHSRRVGGDGHSLWQFFLAGVFHHQDMIAGGRQAPSQLDTDLWQKKMTVHVTGCKLDKCLLSWSPPPFLHHNHCRSPCRGGAGSPSQSGRGEADGCHSRSWRRCWRWRGRSPETGTCTADSWRDTARGRQTTNDLRSSTTTLSVSLALNHVQSLKKPQLPAKHAHSGETPRYT